MASPSPTPILEVQHLTHGWPGHPLFNELGFQLGAGVSLVRGDDGSGKSTLLSVLAGHVPPQRGVLSINGVRLDRQADAYRHLVFWIDPQTEDHDAISVQGYFDALRHHYSGFSKELLDHVVQGLSLEPHLHKPLYMLSAGSKRKVWLSAAFAARLPLTLIDQPFAALDGPSIRFLTELLQEAADHPSRAWLLADHVAPAGVSLAQVIAL
jgi:ABC-type transport system involved in cytochrome c biogenesis ATPase subunit